MEKFEFTVEKMARILNRCDGGRDYPFKQAAKDMEEVVKELRKYNPRTNCRRLIRNAVIHEAQSWIKMWR